jgi:hypothetical protein
MHYGDEIAVGGSAGFTKYWGYSAYDDTYYELEPEGNFVSPWSMAGGKTAIVVRDVKVYAFSPGNVNSVNENLNQKVSDFSLSQNYPNPFNPTTTIKYAIQKRTFVELKVYDVIGREVEVLVNEAQESGYYEIEFNASKLSSGIYFYQIKTERYVETKKMLLVK